MPDALPTLTSWSAGGTLDSATLNSNFSALKNWLMNGNITSSHISTKYSTQTIRLDRVGDLQSSATASVSYDIKVDADFIPTQATLQVADPGVLTVVTLQIKDDGSHVIDEAGNVLTATNTSDLKSTTTFTTSAGSPIASGSVITFIISETANVASSDITVTLTGLTALRSS